MARRSLTMHSCRHKSWRCQDRAASHWFFRAWSAGILLAIQATSAAAAPSIHFVDSGRELLSNRGNNTYDVALGDLDGDGDIDAVVAQGGTSGSQANVIWLNDGDGRFTEKEEALGTSHGTGVAVGDLDGDSDLDVFIANYNAADQVWINQGGAQSGQRGTFIKTQDVPHSPTLSVHLADLDADGDLDAVLAGGEQRVWWNDGAGVFTSGPAMGLIFVNDVAVADLDADNDLDLVFGGEGNFFPSQIYWNEWSNRQRFTAGPMLVTDGIQGGVAVGDLDGDSRIDIYFATSQADVIWWNSGAGEFTQGMPIGNAGDTDVALGDFDRDGDLDAYTTQFIFPGGNLVWRNDGGRNFTSSGLSLQSYNSRRVAVADLDRDGDLDAFVATGAPDKVWLNTAISPGMTEQIRPFANGGLLDFFGGIDVTVGRINNDLLSDVITISLDGVRVWLNGTGTNQPGQFAQSQIFEEGFGQSVSLGDLDRDGDQDAFVAYLGGDNTFETWQNSGGTFTIGQRSGQVMYVPSEAALGDLDGDGDLDAVITSGFASEVWFNGQNGQPLGEFSYGQDLGPAYRVALADLDGDDDVDVMLTGEEASVWLNASGADPQGRFRQHQAIPLRNVSDFALGDLDGDADPDAFLVFNKVQDQPAQPNQIWWNGEEDDPKATFRDSGQRIHNVNSSSVVLADLNGDGDLDAYIGTEDDLVQSHSDIIWLNDGTGRGRVTGQCLGSNGTYGLAVGDLDHDGDLDVVTAGGTQAEIWLNNSGEFCTCTIDWLELLQSSSPAPPASTLQPLAASSGLASTYRALRDQIFVQSEGGRRLARLYDRHNAEVFRLIASNAPLRQKAWSTLIAWAPSVRALLDGAGEQALVSASQAQAVEDFLDSLSAVASEFLSEAIRSERNVFQTSSLGGQTLNQAIARLDLPVEPPPVIRLEAQTLPDRRGIELSWNAPTGRRFRVLRSTDSLESFEAVGPILPGNDGVMRYAVPFSQKGTEFFQVESIAAN